MYIYIEHMSTQLLPIHVVHHIYIHIHTVWYIPDTVVAQAR